MFIFGYRLFTILPSHLGGAVLHQNWFQHSYYTTNYTTPTSIWNGSPSSRCLKMRRAPSVSEV